MTSFSVKIARSIVLVCFLTLGSIFSLAQKASPFAIPGRPPPPPKTVVPKYPQPKKITPQAKTLPSPYEMRGCYNFEGKWYFALYHKSTRESTWLSWEENSTSVTYAGDVFIFDHENFEVTHESSNPQVSYESIRLAEASKASGAAFNPSAPKASKASPKKPQPPVRKTPPRGLVIPSPKKK
jgi:hypothetical protein